jgi:hypothetical protein
MRKGSEMDTPLWQFRLFRSLYTYYPIRESYLDTWYPLHKYTSGISFVNELLENIK